MWNQWHIHHYRLADIDRKKAFRQRHSTQTDTQTITFDLQSTGKYEEEEEIYREWINTLESFQLKYSVNINRIKIWQQNPPGEPEQWGGGRLNSSWCRYIALRDKEQGHVSGKENADWLLKEQQETSIQRGSFPFKRCSHVHVCARINRQTFTSIYTCICEW